MWQLGSVTSILQLSKCYTNVASETKHSGQSVHKWSTTDDNAAVRDAAKNVAELMRMAADQLVTLASRNDTAVDAMRKMTDGDVIVQRIEKQLAKLSNDKAKALSKIEKGPNGWGRC